MGEKILTVVGVMWKKVHTGFTEQWVHKKGSFVEIRPKGATRSFGYAISIYPANLSVKKPIYDWELKKKDAVVVVLKFIKKHPKGF
jgi:hypothetical protein